MASRNLPSWAVRFLVAADRAPDCGSTLLPPTFPDGNRLERLVSRDEAAAPGLD